MRACEAMPLFLTLSDAGLAADLLQPEMAQGLVVFVHGSGSSRRSPRNQQVARYLSERGLATLLFDLLTEQEQRIDNVTYEMRFDIPLLSRRIIGVIDWLDHDPELSGLHLGLFGASTGAAAALVAAAERPEVIRAVVSRGGRTDLAGASLGRVAAPTLQIVGGEDHEVLRLNREVSQRLHGEQQVQVVPGASHLFEEPGTLDEVERLAGDWFTRFLNSSAKQ
jgi:putative phosphoribosyl transferase